MAENVNETEKVEGEVVNEVAVHKPASMEFRLINPTEDDFLRVIKWNKDELEAAVRQKITDYENVVYTEENMQQAKNDRAELNKLTKAIEDRRKEVKKKINEPYDTFEKELKEVLVLIQKPVGMIDKQIKDFEDKQKEEKKASIKAVYDEEIGDLAEVLSFEQVFDIRYLNKTYKLGTAQEEVREKIKKVRTDLETIDSLDSKYKLNAKDVYIKTMDLSKALAENKRLSDLEEKLEAEKKRKEEEKRKAEEERLEAERQAAEKVKAAEAEKKEWQEPVMEQGNIVTEILENVIKDGENVAETPESVSVPEESVTEPASPTGKAVQSIERQALDAAVDSFTPKPEETKRFRTRFCAVGTKEQLEGLINYMKENKIEYGRI